MPAPLESLYSNPQITQYTSAKSLSVMEHFTGKIVISQKPIGSEEANRRIARKSILRKKQVQKSYISPVSLQNK